MRSIFSTFALAATLGLALVFTFSCSGSGDGDDPNGGGIVNANNEAWVWEGGEGGNVIKQNGEFLKIYRNVKDENWCIAKTGTYSISGNQITVCMYDDCKATPYSLSGNKLTITEGKANILTRTSGVYVNGNCPDD